MEVSSQALKLHRVNGIMFDAAVFTNLREDHIGAGEHADFAEYMACKHRLFCQCRIGIFNQDDPYWQEMWRGSSCEKVLTYGFPDRQITVQTGYSFCEEATVWVCSII